MRLHDLWPGDGLRSNQPAPRRLLYTIDQTMRMETRVNNPVVENLKCDLSTPRLHRHPKWPSFFCCLCLRLNLSLLGAKEGGGGEKLE